MKMITLFVLNIWNKNKTLFVLELCCPLLVFALTGYAKESMARAPCVKLVNQRSSHTICVWQWGQIYSGGAKLKYFNPIYPETIC